MAKANNLLKTKETEAVVVAPEQTVRQAAGTATVVTTSSTTAGNFILVRAARSESGQLILQNGHELLSLLNADAASLDPDNSSHKSIVLQAATTSATLHHRGGGGLKVTGGGRGGVTDSTNSIAVQPTTTTILKGTTLDGHSSGGSTIFLQAGTNVKKGTLTADGSIILQQRLKTSGGSDSGGGPILLQTLKRLDKTPSILVIRNTGSAIPAATATPVASTSKIKLATARNHGDDRKEVVVVDNNVVDKRPSNIPLGSGE